ncbi:MAG: UDP-N-acetylglucosamine--N-acetylmuramyl-(pentapeptide) pyrophosphoryl-undecaprenol N-acetylglucosamine transferase [Parcubacteria group bacterium]|nr:UDP-N-acetylglucosamine--N-acetylmuramyl-(pentapeptide) pyrophosphoryl-undecaprenol N-acetylglucosamine transferase [Parcubacteria group bacterium]
MKILLTGGGSAGHFYPLIAIADAVRRIAEKEKLVKPELYYLSTSPYDERVLFDNDIVFKRVFAGKMRRYFSLLNLIDIFPMTLGLVKALWSVYFVYPDVVVSKGGYASIPAVFAARLLNIPVIIHESDAVPGRANRWAARFAVRIALSWPEAQAFFPAEKTAVTGQPVREEIKIPSERGAREYLHLEEEAPVVLVLGGSQGAERINQTILDSVADLVERFQIIHQVGVKNLPALEQLRKAILGGNVHKERYHPFGYLNALALRMSAGAADLVVSRAGSTIFEIAAWGRPSIIIPLTDSNGDHQRRNAFNYARSGACIVIEEKNLTPHVLLAEIQRLMDHREERERMAEAAKSFFVPGAAEKIAQEAITIALKHER